MLDHVGAIRTESARFLDLIESTAMDALVPSCPGWTVSELAWHLTEVQQFWAAIAGRLLTDPAEVQAIDRPGDGDLAGLFARVSAELVDAVERQDPDSECWSWHDAARSVGWVRRRQAHEALIHRVDAELAAGGSFDVDPMLAADGVDELLGVFLDSGDIPPWAAFEADGSTAIVEIDGGGSWMMELGRLGGTSPNSGRSYDDAALRLVTGPGRPTAAIRGSGADVDLWLWGRGPLDRLTIEGDTEAAQKIRAAAAAGTR